MSIGGAKGGMDSSEGGVLGSMHCFGGAETCGVGGPDGGVLSVGALVCSSSSISDAVVVGRIPLPSGTVVTVPTPPPTSDCLEVWGSFVV
jgi:hypothetical protein